MLPIRLRRESRHVYCCHRGAASGSPVACRRGSVGLLWLRNLDDVEA
jgi:hypothetical protein